MHKTTAISANSGQTVRIPVQTVDGYGARIDGYVPVVQKVFFPDGTEAEGYPTVMTQVDTGLYVHELDLPGGTSYLGTYIVSIFYDDPDVDSGDLVSWEIFMIHSARPFGNSSITPG